MNLPKCKICCSYLDKVMECILNEDTSYLYPSNWNITLPSNLCCMHSRPTTVELDEIKKEIEAIKKLNGYNINPLCNSNNTINEDNIIDDDIKQTIVNLKTDLQRCNDKLDELELNVKNGIGTDAFCIVEKE